MTTLSDVRAALIARGYPAEQADATPDLAGRMTLEDNPATRDDVNAARDELAQFRVDMAGRFAQIRVEMIENIAELRVEMNERFAEQRSDSDARKRRISKRVAGAVMAGQYDTELR